MKNEKRTVTKFIAAVVSAAITLLSIMTLSTCMVFAESDNTQGNDSVLYTGEAVTLPVVIADDGTLLQNGVDYDLTYENNINVGTATIIITFKGNYEGERTVDFNIVAKTLSESDVMFAEIDKQTYTGGDIKPEPTITYGDIILEKEKDYTLTYENNTDVGTGKINVTFIGNYTGTASVEFEIAANELTTDDVSFSTIEKQIYTGDEITPEPAITYGDIMLEKDKDYTLEYENNINAGAATVKVSFIGNYTGAAVTTFEIAAKAVTDENVTISDIPDQTYTGSAVTPQPIIVDINR